MHRYGLVYLWHNKELENQNRSVTKERRDGQAPSPLRNKNRTIQRPQKTHHRNPTSIQSEPQHENSLKIDDASILAIGEIGRVKADVERAIRRVEKTAMDWAEAQKRVSEMEAGLKSLAGGDSRNEEAYNNLLQLAKRESERRQKERLMALSELQSKEQLLARLTHRKCSM